MELTVQEMWYRSEAEECGATGMPDVSVWQTHYGAICDELFPDLSGLRTGTGNINRTMQYWVVCWLKESLQTARKTRTRMIKGLAATEGEIARILGPDFWRDHVLNLAALDMKKVASLSKQLGRWTAQLGWTMKQSDEESRKDNELAEDSSEAEMASRWQRISDASKKMEWAGWGFGQVETLVNSLRHQNKRRELDLTTLANPILKAASKY